MKYFADVPIKIKIALISVIAVIGFVVILAYNYTVTTSNKVRLENLKNKHYPVLQYATINTNRLGNIKEMLNIAATSGESDMLEDPDELAKLMKLSFDEISKIDPDLSDISTDLTTKFSNYYQVAREVSSEIIDGTSPEDIYQNITAMNAKLDLFTVALEEFSNNVYHQFNSTIEGADNASSKALNVSVIIFAIVLAIFIVTSVTITRMITMNIGKVVSILNDTSNGDLTKRLTSNSKDEIGQMATALNSMIKKINTIVMEMMSTSGQMASSSEQLLATSRQIADGGEAQLSRASQVATASQQMSATVVEVAQNASGAAEAAKEANSAASHGGDIVKKTIDSMNGIAETTKVSSSVIAGLSDRSNEIGNIIGVIDDIADQTNLLALNAAIEAARAGEQGRGFAVVADEVRKLAERTTKATKEIGSMIKAIQDDTGKALSSMEAEVKVVEEGVSLASEAGSAIETIIEQVDTVTSMIQQIATASEEQSTAADQISGDVEMVADIARDSSTSTQQITSVSEEIARLASDLQQIVAMFKVVSK